MPKRSLPRRPAATPGRRTTVPGPTRSSGRRSRGGLLARIIPAAVIAAAIAVVLVIAFGQLGGASSSARTEREVVSAADGVVQTTVTGTGNLEPVTQDDVDFQTSGTLKTINVKDDEYVHKGQLLGTLDSATDALTLKQARATLAEARTTLTSDEKTLAAEDDDASSDDTSATVRGPGVVVEDVEDALTATTATTAAATATTTTTPAQTATTTPTQTATTTPTQTTTTTPTQTATTTPTRTLTTTVTSTAPTATTRTGSSAAGSSGAAGSSDDSGSSDSSGSSSTDVTAATIDSDKLAIVNDEAAVKGDSTALDETRLTAPVSGTIVSLESIDAGDSVSSGTDSSASSDASAGDSTSDAATGSTGSSSSDASTGSTAASSSSSSSSTFVEIDSLRHLSMTVSFTEADISELKVGQAATVSLDALSGVELAGKVTAVSSLGTTDDDVVSYDATVTLDQYDSQVKPGMSASADVIIKQGHGVTVPTAAVTGTGNLATVTEQVNGKDTTKKVIVGLRGTSQDLIVSGVKAGAELVETETLPSKGSGTADTTTSGASASGAFGAGAASGGFGGRAAGGFGGGARGGGVP